MSSNSDNVPVSIALYPSHPKAPVSPMRACVVLSELVITGLCKQPVQESFLSPCPISRLGMIRALNNGRPNHLRTQIL